MDPSYALCRVYDTFKEASPRFDVSWYSHSDKPTPATSHPRSFEGGRDRRREIGNSVFVDYDGVILANLDVLNLTMSWGGLLAQQTIGKLTYALIGGEGGWIDYLQWRRPECYGYVIVPRDGKLAESIVYDLLTIYYGQDNTGKIATNAESFADYVRGIQVDGVDLALSQEGGTQALLACVRCLKEGGTCVIQYTQPELLYLMALSFGQVTLFRPLADSRKLYCVGRGYHKSDIVDRLRSGQLPQLSEGFVQWLNSLPDPSYPINLARAKAIWAIPDSRGPPTGLTMTY